MYRIHNGKIYSLPALPSFLLFPRDKEHSVIFFFRLLAFFSTLTYVCTHTQISFLFFSSHQCDHATPYSVNCFCYLTWLWRVSVAVLTLRFTYTFAQPFPWPCKPPLWLLRKEPCEPFQYLPQPPPLQQAMAGTGRARVSRRWLGLGGFSSN